MRFQDLLHQGAHRSPDKIAFRWIDRGQVLTYAQSVEMMEKAAGALAKLNICPGDRVGIFAHNGLDYLTAMFGTWRLGAIVALINLQLANSLDYYVNDSKPKVLIYTGDYLKTIDKYRTNMPSIKHYICLDGKQSGAMDWQQLIHDNQPAPQDTTQEKDAAHLSYTSGTTGSPKGAVLAHEPTSRATHCIAERLQLRSSDVTLGPTSLSSSYHLVANLLPGLHRGCTVNVMTHWQPDIAWEVMEELDVSLLAANPIILKDLLNESYKKGQAPSKLRVGLSGGGPVPVDLKRKWRDEMKVALVESYGQSELGGFVGLGFPELLVDEKLSKVGMALPDKEVRIFDENDFELPVGEVGELVIRGGFMAGYWEKPEKTAETLRGGWLHTNDLGKMDSEGYITFLGRKQEQITYKGRVIFPRPIEEALLRHTAVKFAAVIGIPDKSVGEFPKGIVVLNEGSTTTPEELLHHYQMYQDDETFLQEIEIIPEMPMTPTGKINKVFLETHYGKAQDR